ncbi:hypothetical protein HYFRA_00006804 [Hymenoscyphus fraxineus]|uniref:Uncharacterized protein n=1 Tax=Hymenoscyphus fraxineus TaxID=746836 RepID=A0A9N9KNP9_9HELO|nr:hypothetical protein HYFRA_00006804 [Hymenoscyphus fraxineus]
MSTSDDAVSQNTNLLCDFGFAILGQLEFLDQLRALLVLLSVRQEGQKVRYLEFGNIICATLVQFDPGVERLHHVGLLLGSCPGLHCFTNLTIHARVNVFSE